jgi:hypothetical protein
MAKHQEVAEFLDASTYLHEMLAHLIDQKSLFFVDLIFANA